MVDSNLVAQAVINYSPQNLSLTEVTGKYFRTDPTTGAHVKDIKGQDETISFRTKARLYKDLEEKILKLPQFEVREPNTMLVKRRLERTCRSS